jgi:hemolysin
MHCKSLYVAVAIALSAQVVAAPALWEVPKSRQSMAYPLHDQIGTMPLSQLPDFFSKGSSVAIARLTTQGGLRQSLGAQLATSKVDDPLVGWVAADALMDPKISEHVATMYSSGMPVLVIGSSSTVETEKNVATVVGVTSGATIAIYYRGDGRHVRIFSIDEPDNASVDVSKALRQALSSLKASLIEPAPILADPVESIALPIFTVTDDAFAGDGSGASVTQQVDIIRDSNASRDQYVVAAKATHNLIPSNNGLGSSGLTLPEVYRVTQRLGLDSQGTPAIAPTLQLQYPASTASTTVSFTDTQSTTTSYGFNISNEISGGLQGMVPEASAKTAFGFTFGKSYVDEKAYNFSVQDYNVGAGATAPTPISRQSTWDFALAATIRSNTGYFGNPPTMGRFTPMMERATVQTYSRWVVTGTYNGGFTIDAGAPQVMNVSYTGSAINQSLDARRQPTSTIRVPERLAYLSRETSVMIQSQLNSGGCLYDDSGVVRLITCPTPSQPGYLNTYVAQWQLDAESRYVNRGTGRCMAIHLESGGTITQPCSFQLEQRWEWRADRLHSLYDSATANWRLHVINGQVRSDTDLAIYQDLPVNPNHPLLNPWSNYPSAPVPGVTIPTYNATQPAQIPEDWLRFKAVSSDQVWRVIPIRANI